MSGAEIMAVGGFIMLLLAHAFGVWKYVDGRISATGKALDEFKLYVSEKYIKAESLQKMEERQIASEARMIASLEALGERIDRLVDRLPARRS